MLGYRLDISKGTIDARYERMIQAKDEYLEQHGERLIPRYEDDYQPGSGLPGAPSERYGKDPQEWLRAQFQPFSTVFHSCYEVEFEECTATYDVRINYAT